MQEKKSVFDQFQIVKSSGQSTSDLRTFALVVIFYAFLVTALFSPVLFTGRLLAPDDGIVQNLPAFYGDRTLWSSLIYSGYPLVADPLVQFFYPLSLFFARLPSGWNMYVVLGYALSGGFLFLYLKLLTNSTFASLAGGIAFSLGGYLMCESLHVHVVHAAFWFTGILVLLEYLARKSSLPVFQAGCVALCMCTLNGHMQELSYLLGVCSLYIVVRSTALAENKIRYVFAGVSLIVLGLILSAIQLIPTAELASFSCRKQFTFNDFLTYSMHPLEAVGIFLPFLFGGAPDGIINLPYFGNFICPPDFLYLGFIPLVLSLSAFMVFPGNRLVIFWGVIGFAAFLLSFGNGTPLALVLYHIPPYGFFRALHRILLISSLANAILCGIALAAIEKNMLSKTTMSRVLVGMAGVLLGLLGAIFYLSDIIKPQASKFGITNFSLLPWTNPAIGIPCLVFIASALALAFFLGSPKSTTRRITLIIVLLCDLGFNGWYAQSGTWRLKSPCVEILNPPITAEKYVPLAGKNHNRILTVRGGCATVEELPPNLCRLWGVPSASGYEPLMLKRYGELLSMTEGGFLTVPWHYNSSDRSFDILSVKYAMTAKGDTRLEQIWNSATDNLHWQKVEDLGTASIHENLKTLPRCWLVNNVVRLEAKNILEAIKTSRLAAEKKFDPLETALVEQPLPTAMPSDFIHQDAGSAKIKFFAEQHIEIETNAANPSFLVLSDIFYPGWKATVDGSETPIFRTDYILRGIVVPKGKHAVEFNYLPSSFYLGATISGVGFVLIFLVLPLISSLRKRKI